MFNRWRISGWSTVVVVAVLAAGGGWAFAASTNKQGVLHACAAKQGGALRLAHKCRKSERAVSWNIHGVPGAPGTNGASGTNGTNGSPGAPGTARAYGVITSTGNVVAAKSKNLTAFAVTSQGPGVYCVNSPGIDPATVQPIATADFDDGVGDFHIVQTIDAETTDSPDCPGGWVFITHSFAGGNWTATNIAISVVVP